jgi:cell division protein FtsI/penicillin-binding protein 2
VTSYQALKEQYYRGRRGVDLNPLTLVDDYYQSGGQTYLGSFDGKPLPQNYKGGRIPRSHRAGIGKVDLMRAMEVSSNPYFSLLAKEVISSPNNLIEAAKNFGFAERTSLGIAGEKRGLIPQDLDIDPTALYSTAIGHHTLMATPIQLAVMLSSIANGGTLLKPRLVQMVASPHGIRQFKKEVKREIDFPKPVRQYLIEGMRRVVANIQQGVWSLKEMYRNHPEALSDLLDLKGQMVGKSSTTEVVEQIDMDVMTGTNRYNHLGFGAIVFEPAKEGAASFLQQFSKPEIVVVVYQRFGSWGKDCAPIAAQVAMKWREIKCSKQKDFVD